MLRHLIRDVVLKRIGKRRSGLSGPSKQSPKMTWHVSLPDLSLDRERVRPTEHEVGRHRSSPISYDYLIPSPASSPPVTVTKPRRNTQVVPMPSLQRAIFPSRQAGGKECICPNTGMMWWETTARFTSQKSVPMLLTMEPNRNRCRTVRHSPSVASVARTGGVPDGSRVDIGLAVCERIVERPCCRIWVESRPDECATLCLTLSERKQN